MANTDTTVMTIDDLAFVLRLTHAQTLVSPSDIVTASSEKINSRYARELLALGTSVGLFYNEEDDQLGDVWMLTEGPANDLTDTSDPTAAHGLYFEMSEQIAADALKVDKVVRPKKDKTKVKPAPAASRANSTGAFDKAGNPRLCTCGCGAQVQGKSLYKPGHDARHAGFVARHIAAQPTDEHEFDALNALPTQALRDKAVAHAERLIAKNAKKGKVEEQPPFTPRRGTIKIGRWTYDVETTPEGQIIAYKKNGQVHATLDQTAQVAWS